MTRLKYDVRNRHTTTIHPDGGFVEYRYDLNNNLIGLTDPLGNTTRFIFDSRDRMTLEIDPFGKATELLYDAVDNLRYRIDRNGRVTKFDYDELNRLVQEDWVASRIDPTLSNEISYTYDKTGNLLSVEDYFSKLTHTYDDRNRVKTVDNAGTPEAPHVELTYAYDNVGNVSSVTDTIDGLPGATTGYDHDVLNRLVRLTQSGTDTSDKRVDFTYNALGQYTAIDRYSDLAGTQLVVATEYFYDDLNRLKDLEHASSSNELLAFYRYSYDTDSRITQIVDIDGTTDYSYDDRDQLTGADRKASDIRGDENYRYDANGNRLESHLHGVVYQTGEANRLLSDGTFSYDYDDEGNMILRTEIATGDTRKFEWDHRNRLVRVTDRSSDLVVMEANYVYDSLNRRIQKLVDADGAGSGSEISEHYVYNHQHVALEFLDRDGSAVAEQPALELRNVFGPDVDQVLAQDAVNASQTRWLLTDHLGTVREIVGDSGEIHNRILYNSYGQRNFTSPELGESRYGYTGREHDEETGALYLRARNYDPALGRFMSQDPIGRHSGDTNYYRYVANNPVAGRDPSGLVEWSGTIRTDSVSLPIPYIPVPGAFSILFDMSTTMCVGGKRARVVGTAILGGVSQGLAATFSNGSITMNDDRTTVDTTVFVGRALLASGAGGAGDISFGGIELTLGGAFGRSSGRFDSGVDGSLGFGAGYSFVTKEDVADCVCSGGGFL